MTSFRRYVLSPESKKSSKLSIRDAVGPAFSKKIKSTKHHAVRDELGEILIRDAESSKSEEEHPGSIRYALRSELSWTHYRLLIRVENEAARTWYMDEAASQNWSTRVLERQINSLYFTRLLSSKNKKELVKKRQMKHRKTNLISLILLTTPTF